jgi:hypothetical protein
MKMWGTMKHYVLPTKENVYRPHLLGKSWLVFFLALSLGVEGFLVTGLVSSPATPSDIFLTQTPTDQNLAAAASAPSAGTLMQNFGRQTLRVFGNSDVANSTLFSIGTLLMILAALAFFRHIDIQSREMLLGAVAVSFVAFLCFAANIHFLGAGIGDLHRSAAAVSLGI